MKKQLIAGILLLASIQLIAQHDRKDKSSFQYYEPGYYQNSILKGVESYEKKKEPVVNKGTFKLSVDGLYTRIKRRFPNYMAFCTCITG